MLPNPINIQPTSAGLYASKAVNTRQTAEAAESEAQKQRAAAGDQENFSIDERRQIDALKARNAEVKAHERAHLNAASGIAVSGASYSYQTGPDGNRYAIGGEINIDTSPVAGDPEATMRKAELIRRAALAPAQPSSQDYSVAARAALMAIEARIELLKQTQDNFNSKSGTAIDIDV